MQSFADIISPITLDEFYKDYYLKKPLHIKASDHKKGEGRFKGLPGWQGLSALLNQTSIWSDNSLNLVIDRKKLPPEVYCTLEESRDSGKKMRPQPAKVKEWLAKGASLVANDIDNLSPALKQISRLLEGEFMGLAQANLYCSSHQRQAFDSHFDTHEVFVFHVEGEKRWKIYETIKEFPIAHKRYDNAAYTSAQREAERGKVLMDIVMRPGDFLYVPRGQYHDAMAAKDGSIHVTYGLVPALGLDIVNLATDMLVDQPLFRQAMPNAQKDMAGLKAHLAKLADATAATIKSDEFARRFAYYQNQYHYDRDDYDLPVKAETIFFAVMDGFSLQKQAGKPARLIGPKGAVDVPPDKTHMIDYVLAQKGGFDRLAFMDHFAAIPGQNCDRFLQETVTMGVIKIVPPKP